MVHCNLFLPYVKRRILGVSAVFMENLFSSLTSFHVSTVTQEKSEAWSHIVDYQRRHKYQEMCMHTHTTNYTLTSQYIFTYGIMAACPFCVCVARLSFNGSVLFCV